MTSNYVESLLILTYSNLPIPTITGCVSISAFTSFDGIPLGIASSDVGLKIFAITAGMKMYKLNIKKKKTKRDKIVLQGKTKSDTIKILI